MMIAVYQAGHAVFGVGFTLADAVEDANEWLGSKVTAQEIDHSWGTRDVDGAIYWAWATPRLCDKVRACGGDIAFNHAEPGLLDVAEPAA